MIKYLKFAVIVPTLNAGEMWNDWIFALQKQSIKPERVLVLDSESDDDTVKLAFAAGFDIEMVSRSSFNHGGTRQFGVEALGNELDALVCLTQDAILADENALIKILSALNEPDVGAAYGRQLPHSNATPLAIHARLFNYPQESRKVILEDRQELGFKACFLSNSFAVYRLKDLWSIGGFPRNVILGEDSIVAARMLLAGRAICYQADAIVYHSHNYRLVDEFRRYFDTGVFHSHESWLIDAFGGVGGEGKRFVFSEMRYLVHNSPNLLFVAILRTALKLLGYRLGRIERLLPLRIKRQFSMFRSFWSEQKV